MKPIILSIILTLSLLSACNNNKQAPGTETSSKEKNDSSGNSQSEATDPIQKKAEELQELTPLTIEELRDLLPEELIGASRKSGRVGSENGTIAANYRYVLNDSAQFELTIADCGGPAGAGYYSRQALQLSNQPQDEYNKLIDYNGEKALTHSRPPSCGFTYFGGKRFWVVMGGVYITPDDLKMAAGELKLK